MPDLFVLVPAQSARCNLLTTVTLAVVLFVGPAVAIAQQPTGDADPVPDQAAKPAGIEDLSVEDLYIDLVHFTMLGRFDIASAYGRELLDRPEADPDTLLVIADQQARSRETLIWATSRAALADVATEVLKRIAQGERNKRKDSKRIIAAIDGLAGGARAELNNARRLRDSGEYAIPWIIQALQDPKKTALHARIARTLPKIGKAAVSPLVAALDVDDPIVLQTLIRSLARIGYPQAVPGLKVLAEDVNQSDDVRRAAAEAIARILPSHQPVFSMSAADALFALAEDYWDNAPGVRADPRVAETNVWYWRDGFLRPTPVPTEIYEDVMAMRNCESALRLRPDFEPAVALWLASNFRREAELGMDVESEGPDDARMALDATRPPGFLRGIYYARSAGPRFCHRTLGRALKAGNSAVALGAIAALKDTSGPAGLVGIENEKQPLVEALVYPDRAVRIKAALALAAALPPNGFSGEQNVVPVLAEALAQTGVSHAVIIDPDRENRNRIAALLADENVNSLSEDNVLKALARVHKELPAVDVVFIASDVARPTLAETLALLRRDFRLANTPLIFLARRGDDDTCDELALGHPHIAVVPSDAPKVALLRRWDDTAARVGRVPLDADEALDLAIDACHVLDAIAVSRSPVFAFDQATPALIIALQHPAEDLRIEAAFVLAHAASPDAQNALAAVAVDPDTEMTLRLPAFESLADSAKRNGNLLNADNLTALKELTISAADPVIRTNASRALGALNLPASEAATPIILGDAQSS